MARLPGVVLVILGLSGLLLGYSRVSIPQPGIRSTDGWQVNVRSAERETLQLLPGIGPVLADRILAWQQVLDGEPSDRMMIENMITIPGIGTRTIERLRPFIEMGVCSEPVVHDQ